MSKEDTIVVSYEEELEDSIAHWTRLAEFGVKATKSDGSLETPYALDCALCHKFLHQKYKLDCFGCPISAKIGKTHCVFSIYTDAAETYDRARSFESEGLNNLFKEKAKIMRDFLITLRPTTT